MDEIVGGVGARGADTAAAIRTINSCCGASAAAPTPSSLVLSVAATAPSSTLPTEEDDNASETTKATRTATTTTTTATHRVVPLPWDFTATELCRSCGKPQTELYELFEHASSSIGSGVISGESNNNNNAPSLRESTIAAHSAGAGVVAPTTETAANQHNKMENILQEMQIWQLGVELNDGLPQRICSKCSAQFNMIGKFRRKCLKVQTRLQALYEERRLEEQQLLQRLDDKQNLDIPPVLEISNDLINDNYGQPLSEVELFESNWTADETNNESLSHDLLGGEQTKSSINARSNDNENELTCAGAAELHNVAESGTDCPDLVLNSNTGLVNSMDLAVKANIDDESLLDTHAIFKTHLNEQLTEDVIPAVAAVEADCSEKGSELQLEEQKEIPLVSESSKEDVDSSTNELQTKRKESLIKSQSENISVSECVDENLPKSSVDIICIENLKTIDLLTSSTSKQAPVELNRPEETDTKNPYKQNYEEQKDCNLGEEEEGEITTEQREEESQQLLESDLMETKNQAAVPTAIQSVDSKDSIEMKSGEQELLSTTLLENRTDEGDNASKLKDELQTLSPASTRDSKEETTKFVSKAALKEYSTSPICYESDQRINESDNITNEIVTADPCSMKSSAPSSAPQTMECQSANIGVTFKSPPASLHEAVKSSSHSQKRRRRDKLTAKPKSLMKQQHKIETDISNKITDVQRTRECSVRLCRLSASQLLRLVNPNTTTTTTTTESACDSKESINQLYPSKDVNISDYRDCTQNVRKQRTDDEYDSESAAVSKKPRLTLRRGEEGLQSHKKRGSQWKTKAEMKANVGLLGLRKSSLRRQWKAADAEHCTDTQAAVTKDETPKTTSPHIPKEPDEKHVITDHATEVLVDEHGLHEQPAPTTTTTQEHECEKGTSAKTLQYVVHTNAPIQQTAAGGHQAKRKGSKSKHLGKQAKLFRANLMKLRQRSIVGDMEIESEHRGRGDGPLASNVPDLLDAQDKPGASDFATWDFETTNYDSKDININRKHPENNTSETKIAETLLKDPLEKVIAAESSEALNNETTQANATKCSAEIADFDIVNTNEPSSFSTAVANENIDLQVTSKSLSQIEGAPRVDGSPSVPNQNQNQIACPREPSDLIVRVPLTVLTEEFQKLHFFTNTIMNPELNSGNLTDKVSQKSDEPVKFIKSDPQTKLSAESWTGTVEGNENDEHAFVDTQTNFCESAAAEPCSESAGARSLDCERATEIVGENKVASSQNDSDQSEFYGFSNESDATSYDTQDDADASLLEKCSTSISSQINDYINDFQTHCLDIDDVSEPTFSHDIETAQLSNEQDQSMLQIPTPRDSSTHLSNSVMDSFVDNTLNGLLNDIQEQSIFSPSTTPIVTMESEDFHNHSSYSPLSEASSDLTHSTHNDFIHKANIYDLTDPGPIVNPSHTIERVNPRTHGMPCDTSKNVYPPSQQHHYSDYVECFAEDSTQSELIGFQNDIPCFENIELNSSTPHRNSTPPPGTIVGTQTQLTPSRGTNSALQGAVVAHGKNLEYTLKPTEAGNVQYLGLANQNDLCNSLSTDSMGLVCTTGNGVQMHRPTMSSTVDGPLKTTMENDTSSSLGDDSKEYAVDSATLHLTQIFSDMPLQRVHDVGPSTSQNCIKPSTMSVDNALPFNISVGKSSVLSKFPGSNPPAKRYIYTKKSVAVERTPNLKDSPQYIQMQPNPVGNISRNAQLHEQNTLPAQISTAAGQGTLNMNNTKYTLYTGVLPQDLQWQTTTTAPDPQQTTTTYYINAGNLNQSNLISTTTISVSPIINGGTPTVVGRNTVPVTDMSNLNMMPNQLVHQTTSVGGMNVSQGRELDKRSMDANENYIEGMQNQPIMIVFPQDYINEAPSVSTLYNTPNQVTITPIEPTSKPTVKIPPPMNPNTITITPTTAGAVAAPPPPVPVPVPAPKILQQSPQPVAVRASPSVRTPPQPQPPQLPQSPQQPQQPPQPQKVNLTCRFCHKRPKFTNNLDYSNHIIATHPGENPYNCPHCPLFFTRRTQRQQHIVEAHSGNRFHCAQCGQSFSAQRTLDVHLQRFHVPPESPSVQLQRPVAQQQMLDVVPSCSQQQLQQTDGHTTSRYRSAASTTWHERSPSLQQQVRVEDMHSQVAEAGKLANHADNTQLATDSIKLNKPPHRILGCPDCDDSFDDLANQEPGAHHISPHSHGCGSANMPSPEQTEPDSTSTTTLRQFRKQRLSSKSSSSAGDPPERVLRSSHNCLFCEERFTSETTLRKHHQLAHGGQSVMPFVCSTCKRGFRMRTALQRHMETHDSVGRPYECSICLVRFPRPSQLTLHKLTVHFLRKPHVCNICGKQFGTEAALSTHERFHGEKKKLDCDECHRKFFNGNDLRKHRRIHGGEHFYKCDICPSTFVHYTRLSAHIKTHIPLAMFQNIEEAQLERERELGKQTTHPPGQQEDTRTEQIEFNDTNDDEIRNPQNSST